MELLDACPDVTALLGKNPSNYLLQQTKSAVIAPISVLIETQEKKEIQIWKSASDVYTNWYISTDELLKEIISFDYSPKIKKLRNVNKEYIDEGNLEKKKEYNYLKSKLPLITFTSHLKDYRDEKHLFHYTGYITLDIDFNDNKNLPYRFDVLKRNLNEDLYTFICFTSPKGVGYGLKVVVKVKINERINQINKELKNESLDCLKRKSLMAEVKSFHSESYKAISKYYSEKYEIVLDSNAEATMGACFMSGDKDIYYNANSSLFNVAWLYVPPKKQNLNKLIDNNFTSTSSCEILDSILNVFLKNCNGRNHATYLLAMQAKYYNISENEILQYVMSKWGDDDFNEKEARRAIKNGFKYTPYSQFEFHNQSNN